MNVRIRPVARPYFSLSTVESWHGVQVFSATLERDTGDNGLSGDRMPCSPWQSVHTGASVSPRATNLPWIPSQKSFSTPLWHWPQVLGMLKWLIDESGKPGARILWAVPSDEWQSLQLAATYTPPLVA